MPWGRTLGSPDIGKDPPPPANGTHAIVHFQTTPQVVATVASLSALCHSPILTGRPNTHAIRSNAFGSWVCEAWLNSPLEAAPRCPRPADALQPNSPSCGNQPAHVSLTAPSRTYTHVNSST